MVNKKKQFSKWLYSYPKTFGFVFFAIMLSLIVFIISLRYKVIKESEEREMSNILNVVEQNFQQILKTSYTTTLTLAMTINDEGKAENFNEIAAQLIDDKSGIDAVQLVPNGIITNVYPLEENKAALNYNILKSHYNIRKEAEKSIERRTMYFAGPIKLIQGGIGVVGRLPVYKNNKFWGFSAVVIKLETLMKSSGIKSIDKSKYYFQFSKKNPATNEEEFFLPSNNNFSDYYYKTVTIPEGDWKLYLISTKKNTIIGQILTSSILGFLLSIVSGFTVYYLLKRPAELQILLKKKSNRLLLSEKQYRALFEQAPVGIAKIDSLSGKHLDINTHYCSILGYSVEELKQINFESTIHVDDLDYFNSKMTQLLNDEIMEFSLEKRFYHKSGKIIIVNLLVAALWKNNSKIKTHMSIIEDITDKKRAEENLKESFNIVTEQNKRLLNFSYIVSHNLRSHTSNIQTIADFLDQAVSKEERDEMIDLLKKVSHSLNETMYNLNEVVNIRTNINLTVEPLNLHNYIEKAINLLNDKVYEKNLTICNTVSKEVLVDYNISYLESILYNFISNAIRYSHTQKKSEVTISFDTEKRILKIADNGIGIDLKKNGDKLFGLYKTFNNSPESKGVGLFISKNQIDAMGGTVTVESELNVGTTFSIFFK